VPINKIDGSILRKTKIPYEIIPRQTVELIRNPDALAIWLYLMTRPQDWVIRKTDIMRRFSLGEMRYSTARKELDNLGLLVQASVRDPITGRMQGKLTWIYAQKDSTDTPDNRHVGNHRSTGLPGTREISIHTESQINTENQTNTTESKVPKKKKPFSDADMSFAHFMYEKILIVAERTRKPNFDKWANTIRLMRQIDNYEQAEIQQVFMWANSNSFWCTNILSPEKFRKKYPVLQSQMKERGNTNGKSKPRTVVERIEESCRARRETESIIDITPHGYALGKDG